MTWTVHPETAGGIVIGYVIKDGAAYYKDASGGTPTFLRKDLAEAECERLNSGEGDAAGR